MNFWKRLFNRKQKKQEPGLPDQTKKLKNKETSQSSVLSSEEIPAIQPLKHEEGEHVQEGKTNLIDKRSIRVFVSSTFRDMIEDRNELMTHCWPELRKYCAERQVELTEVDLRWGISEEQSTRKETLKFCLDEIRACRPFFIGLLGERYGWIPGDDAFTADLKEEQPWLKDIHNKSVTELEILHGVLNNPEMAGRSFFFFRNPEYAKQKGVDFLSDNEESFKKQDALKTLIRKTCKEKNIPLQENYANPQELAHLVLEQLKAAVEVQFPKESIPDPLDKEARDHEAFAEIRRRTYIGRTDYYNKIDKYCKEEGPPLLLLGDSGSGKSALFANWVAIHRKKHPNDFIFQHYIGGTSDSSSHWKLMMRLIKEIKRWTEDNEELPKTNDDLLRDFQVWLAKARIKAERTGVHFIIILDALNQLDDADHGRLLGWLPLNSFIGKLKLMVSTLPGETLDVLKHKNCQTLKIEELTKEERSRMITDYLIRFGKQLDNARLKRLSEAPQAANPLYLKILLDELRVTGTYEKLDERLNDYLGAKDIPALLQKVLTRYQKDYERDRQGLVRDTLSFIWSARRGLTENELLKLLKPAELPQLPSAIWSPFRAALEEGLVDRGGILNYAHDFLRSAVETVFLPNIDKQDDYRIALADYFEAQSPTARTCDELPWLLKQSEMFERLRNCLLNINNFLWIFARDVDELRQYWVDLGDEKMLGKPYLDSFIKWESNTQLSDTDISFAANELASFLSFQMAQYTVAEPLMWQALKIDEDRIGKEHPYVAIRLNNLALLLQATNRLYEAEPLMRRALKINEDSFGKEHPAAAKALSNLAALLCDTNRLNEAEALIQRALKIDEDNLGKEHPYVAIRLNILAQLLKATNRLREAEPLYRRALKINEDSFGKEHPDVAKALNNLALLLQATNRLNEADPLYRRALKINEDSFGKENPNVADSLNNLAGLLQATNRLNEAEPLYRQALKIYEGSFGKENPKVATSLNNLAQLLKATNHLSEAETLFRRALKIYEKSLGENHPDVAMCLNNLAGLLQATNRLSEAEPLYRRALKIFEDSFGKEHSNVAMCLNNLARLLEATNRLSEAEQLSQRLVEILINFTRHTGHQHSHLQEAINSYTGLLHAMGWSNEKIINQLKKMGVNL